MEKHILLNREVLVQTISLLKFLVEKKITKEECLELERIQNYYENKLIDFDLLPPIITCEGGQKPKEKDIDFTDFFPKL